MEHIKKRDIRRNQSKEPLTTGAILFFLQLWTEKASGEEVKRFQESNQVQLLTETKLWTTTSWMNENLHGHPCTWLAPIITALSLSVFLPQTLDPYLLI